MKYLVREKPVQSTNELSGFSEILQSLFVNRGVETRKQAEAFLNPDYERDTHDPFLMKDMEKAVDRMYKAVRDKEKIGIFADYDADGIPGAVVLTDALSKAGVRDYEVYIPHRHNEGFGLNTKAIDILKSKGITLLITIDCGIADSAEVLYAESQGINVIVTDHHMVAHDIPPAYAVLNPKIHDCQYPEKMLCGSGVIFKCVQAFYKKYGAHFNIKPGWEKWFLDMVGIATLSDMVPLTGENRAFAVYGLKVLKKTGRPGLSALFNKHKVSREHLSEDDIGFTITPRINAASRMGEPLSAFNLLSTRDDVMAQVYVATLEGVNNERKGTVAALVKEIKSLLKERSLEDKKVIVLGNPLWRPSLLGLVANTLATEYGRPAFLWGKDGEGVIKGSCRSGGFSSVIDIMQGASHMFSAFGGHGASGGFEVQGDAIYTLDKALEESALRLGTSPTEATRFVDSVITLEDVSWDMYKDIEKLAPYGTGNEKPLFIIKGAHVDQVRSFGKEKNHTEIVFLDKKQRHISAIQFFTDTKSLPRSIQSGGVVDIVAHIEKSTFKKYPELRLRIVEVL